MTKITYIPGEIVDLANGMVSGTSPRTSGVLTIKCNGNITLNDVVVDNNTDKVINFGSSMVNPTTEETAQGWQIAS